MVINFLLATLSHDASTIPACTHFSGMSKCQSEEQIQPPAGGPGPSAGPGMGKQQRQKDREREVQVKTDLHVVHVCAALNEHNWPCPLLD